MAFHSLASIHIAMAVNVSISLVYFLLSFSMLRKTPFSASKYAKDMLAYRKGNPYCFVEQTTALHEHGSKCVAACRFLMSSLAKDI